MAAVISGKLAKARRASGLLGLVVILVLVIVVLGVRWWMKSGETDPDTAQKLTPWKEWKLREKSDEPVPELRAEQPKITEFLKYDANVKEKKTGDPRGEVLMWINPDGIVWGFWSGNYYTADKVNCDIQQGGFSGYLCPGKIYTDEAGQQDLSKLYFLTKGKFVIHASDLKSTYQIQGGDIYVSGWVSPDLSVVSDVTINAGGGHYETFGWKVSLPKKTKDAPTLFDLVSD